MADIAWATGLAAAFRAFSPAFRSMLTGDGQRSARATHFFDAIVLIRLLLVVIVMVGSDGLSNRMWATISVRAIAPREHS
jgi:hypothetical protein